jgi:phosphohistidine phosphatase
MKTLFLLRHAKSSRDDVTLKDFDRPLNERGREDAKLMGRHLRHQHLLLDGVISSPAKRARETAEIFLKAADVAFAPSFDERIYEAGLQHLLKVVSEIDQSLNVVLLIGHNPGFEALAESLTGQYIGLPTATLAALDLSVEQWRDVRPRSAKLRLLVTPKQLKN